jgi:hypothetical protein
MTMPIYSECGIDWEGVLFDLDHAELSEDFEGNLIQEICIANILDIVPSGKYWTIWANSNVTDEEMQQDAEYMDKLMAEAESHGLYIHEGECDGLDVIAGRVVKSAWD